MIKVHYQREVSNQDQARTALDNLYKADYLHNSFEPYEIGTHVHFQTLMQDIFEFFSHLRKVFDASEFKSHYPDKLELQYISNPDKEGQGPDYCSITLGSGFQVNIRGTNHNFRAEAGAHHNFRYFQSSHLVYNATHRQEVLMNAAFSLSKPFPCRQNKHEWLNPENYRLAITNCLERIVEACH